MIFLAAQVVQPSTSLFQGQLIVFSPGLAKLESTQFLPSADDYPFTGRCKYSHPGPKYIPPLRPSNHKISTIKIQFFLRFSRLSCVFSVPLLISMVQITFHLMVQISFHLPQIADSVMSILKMRPLITRVTETRSKMSGLLTTS